MRNRRNFFGKLTAGAAGFLGLRRFVEAKPNFQNYENEFKHYGDLIPDPAKLVDLPKDFSYKVISSKGDVMSDGLLVPGLHDGMAAFSLDKHRVLLIRNHELSVGNLDQGPFGPNYERLGNVDPKKIYDSASGKPFCGGTTNLIYDVRKRQVTQEFLSLTGTLTNCAGGPTPWGSWISCEEDVTKKGEGREKDHGYNFEVPPFTRPQLADPIPLREMGRFNHEAVAVEPKSGIVYQTEDRENGLIYRFIPNAPGNLKKGGRLQALSIRDAKSFDMRNWPSGTVVDCEESTERTKQVVSIQVGMALDVRWIDLDDVESPNDDLRLRGNQQGAAIFARGEGMWYDNNTVYFACTNGGKNKSGQIFKYTPSLYEGTKKENTQPGKITLFAEPNNTKIVEFADNLTVAPWGDLIIAEDGPEIQYLRGITPQGKMYTLARNSLNLVEFAGPCFSKNHKSLFVNMQSPGITLEITGPWQKGR